MGWSVILDKMLPSISIAFFSFFFFSFFSRADGIGGFDDSL